MILLMRITPQMIVIIVGGYNQPSRLGVMICLNTIYPLNEKVIKSPQPRRKETLTSENRYQLVIAFCSSGVPLQKSGFTTANSSTPKWGGNDSGPEQPTPQLMFIKGDQLGVEGTPVAWAEDIVWWGVWDEKGGEKRIDGGETASRPTIYPIHQTLYPTITLLCFIKPFTLPSRFYVSSKPFTLGSWTFWKVLSTYEYQILDQKGNVENQINTSK